MPKRFEDTTAIGPPTQSPMLPGGTTISTPTPAPGRQGRRRNRRNRGPDQATIEEFIGPTLSDIPSARDAFNLDPLRKRSGKVTGGGR